MLGGFYTAASGVLMQERTLNVLSNNMANVKTPGYRAERVISTTFEQALMTRQERGNTAVVGRGTPIRILQDVMTDFDNSSLEETGRPFDMAINGEGFFNIQTTDEEPVQYLTRNGNFDIDPEGFLVLRGVGRVLGEKGEIQVKDSNFVVDLDGTVYSSQNKVLDKLLVTAPAPEIQVEKATNGLYTVEDFTANVPVTTSAIEQKVLERPNIDLNREYTLAMEAQRAFQTCSQALKMIDTINQKSVSQIASL